MASGGIVWTQAAAAALEGLSITQLLNTPQLQAPQSSGPWRPPQWGRTAQVSITLPAGSSITSSGAPSPASVYIFDATLRTEHSRRLRKSQHPVQAGSSITDHAFIEPAEVTLEIGMSDAMDSFTAGAWSSNSSKSVSAYETLVSLQQSRIPLTVTTRLAVYTNMLIEGIRVPDDYKTRHGLRATVSFGEQFMGSVSVQTLSARPQATGASSIGTKQAIPVPSSITQQNQVVPSRFFTTLPDPATVPSAGTWNSNKNVGGS